MTKLLTPALLLLPVVVLAGVDTQSALDLAARLAPVLGFAAGMSIVVNLAAGEGLFEWATSRLTRATGSGVGILASFTALCVVSTVFFSLDTTAIMLTPAAVHIARRQLPLAVVWVANLASLPLPVSNLTNLLAAGQFDSAGSYVRAVMPAAGAALAVCLAAVAAVCAPTLRRSDPVPAAPAPPRAVLVILAATMALLLTPVPYWLTAAVAAAAMAVAVRRVSASLVPWKALGLALALSSAATLAAPLGVAELVSGHGPWALAGAGALAANIANNIPAYVALEPAATGTTELIALLIGVNAGAVVTPWASLATLLWADQLRRAGVRVPWGWYVGCGLVLAPAAIVAATAALHA